MDQSIGNNNRLLVLRRVNTQLVCEEWRDRALLQCLITESLLFELNLSSDRVSGRDRFFSISLF